jgi:hypothetical protein
VSTRRDLLRRLGLTAALTAGMSALTAIFPEIASAQNCIPNGCKCRPGTSQGQYCGWCDAVTNAGNGGKWSDMFECGPSGQCCRYGPRTVCQDPENHAPCP